MYRFANLDTKRVREERRTYHTRPIQVEFPDLMLLARYKDHVSFLTPISRFQDHISQLKKYGSNFPTTYVVMMSGQT